jgi:dTDP-glucose pyrophosphorylase/CBS domain-containing protein
MTKDFELFLVEPETPINRAIERIDRNSKGIVLVTDPQRHLLGTITDGDIRRTILAGIALDSPVRLILDQKNNRVPLSAPQGTSNGELLKLMQQHVIHQLPLLDNEQRVVDLMTLDELMPEQLLPIQAVVMAGGFGKRLYPLTDETPKPMLPVGDRPLMEHIIDQLRDAGIEKVNVTTHFMPEKIKKYFGNGQDFGVNIEYVSEDRPLGTAGALGLMEKPDQPMLVINGDILTKVDFRSMLDFHCEHQADLTVAVRRYDLQIPYGVIETEGVKITQVREKPLYTFFVNAGIYLLEPNVYQFIPNNERFDMTDLIDRLIAEGRTVISFPIREYWLDIGQPDDYKQAQEDLQNGRLHN